MRPKIHVNIGIVWLPVQLIQACKKKKKKRSCFPSYQWLYRQRSCLSYEGQKTSANTRLIDDLLLLIQSLTCGLAIVTHVVNQ